jgi:hypothetical protein
MSYVVATARSSSTCANAEPMAALSGSLTMSAMIRSRTGAPRAPAAPLRGRFAPPDPPARSQDPAAIRDREGNSARLQQQQAPSHKPQTGRWRFQVDAGKAGIELAEASKDKQVARRKA